MATLAPRRVLEGELLKLKVNPKMTCRFENMSRYHDKDSKAKENACILYP
jgi:hypothetical protein